MTAGFGMLEFEAAQTKRTGSERNEGLVRSSKPYIGPEPF